MGRRLALWSTVKAAWTFVPKAYAHAWGAVALGVAPVAAAVLTPVAEQLRSHPAKAWIAAGLLAVMLLAGLIRDGALYRLGVAQDAKAARALGLGPAGLQLGAVELRLLAGGLLVGLFLLLIFIAGVVVLLFTAAAAGLGEVDWSAVRTRQALAGLAEPWKLWLLGAMAAGVCLLLLRLAVQLSLFAPATVGRARVVSLDSLALTDGKAFALTLGLIAVHLPTIAWVAARSAGEIGASTPWTLVELAVAGLLQPVLTAGFLSSAYRGLEYLDAKDRGDIVHG